MIYRSCILFLLILLFDVLNFAQSQTNNSISGFVFAGKNQPLTQVNVELLDEYGRFVGRILTDNSGRYNFYRIAAGKYQIRVQASQYDLEEQVQDAEIINFSRQTSSGSTRISGADSIQLNFYLKPRKNSTTQGNVTGVVFAQEVPEEAQKYYKQALSDLNQQKINEGLIGLEKSVEIFPAFFYALDRLGQEYINQQKFDKAEITLRKAVEVNPKSSQTFYSLAYALYSNKKLDESLLAAHRSVEINGSSAETRLLLGVIYRENKKYKEAEKEFIKAKEVSKVPFPDVHWQLALLYNYNLKEYKLAADELELYLKAKPDNKDEEVIKKIIKQLREKSN